MATLEVPLVSTPTISPKTSTAALRPRIIPHENSLAPVGHARRASQEDMSSPIAESAVSPCTMLPSGIELPKTKMHNPEIPTLQHDTEEHIAGKSLWGRAKDETVDRHAIALIAVDELDLPHADGKLPIHHHGHHAHLGTQPVKTIYAGPAGNQKLLQVPTELLEAKSRYFRKLFEHDPDMDHMVFEDADPFAMGLWLRWLMTGNLEALDSFHSLTHWYGLYAISVRFDMEELRNHAMDTIRHYYRGHIQTASPFRIEYVYQFAPEQDQLRDFVIASAASRAIITGQVSESMRGIITKGGDIGFDFAQALINYSRDPTTDVRASPDCQWHIHNHTQPCDGGRVGQVDGA
ncbi:hypothetical protein AMS68_005773 [Peltaster fructicola]|uniref:BTB domain-containing protein n=1 Tax=Peltaster fructicola TaxID=286661 RepID=A0A6H0XZZ2_9PEZI|nr:hypothetical protein AMS68_005773 [Peltaster fructicola]